MNELSEMKIHIIGIGGTGMAPIAIVLHEIGAAVTGSDRAESVFTRDLRSRGIHVMVPQTADNIKDPDFVFYSSAIHDDNPELAEARRRGIPTLKRREFLGLMLSGRKTIAIAGSHGKSTTTSMAVWVFSKLGLDPGFIIGSTMKDLGRNAAAGKSDWFIIEADEYDNMFLGLDPYAAALTKVEYDHPDCFPTQKKYFDAFGNFLDRSRADGVILMNGDDENQSKISIPQGRKTIRYGLKSSCDFRGENLKIGSRGCYTFDFCAREQKIPVTLNIPGIHNVSNALLVLTLCAVFDLDLQKASDALASFHGIGRRFEIVYDDGKITLVDDYGHHPTEIKATLKAGREYFPGRKIWAIWQPHTYSRTQALLDEFSKSFNDADELIITDIYAARESFSGFGIDDLMKKVSAEHPSVHHTTTNEDTAAFLAARLESGDVVITLSAGDANKAAPMAVEMINNAGK